MQPHVSFDYIIVGAGSAGSVLASRLSEDPGTSILLLEAGPADRHPWIHVPLGVGKILTNDRYLWRSETGAEPGLDGNRVAWPSGKVLGGSSSVNGMIVVRGHPAKYDEWAASGCPGWSFEEVLPYFKRLENVADRSLSERGQNGPISVSSVPKDKITDGFIAACASEGYRELSDYNTRDPQGVSRIQLSTGNGLRSSTAVSYLKPAAKRPNLTVLTEAAASRILFDGMRATAVEFSHHGETKRAIARREILLCAGSVRSPQLLELSGLGDEQILRNHGITVLKHLPMIGENLQDHMMVRVGFECNAPLTVNDLLINKLRLFGELTRYAITRKGLFSTSSLTATAFVKSNAEMDIPDMRVQIGLTSGEGRLSAGRGSGLDPFSGFHLGAYPIYPKSRGATHIQSSDPRDMPSIRANYLVDEEDQKVTIAGFEIMRAIARHKPLADYIVREIRPGATVTGQADLLQYAKSTGHTCWHPIGTCKMGSDANSILNPQFQVCGVENLRVIDGSAMPFLVSSNTNIPIIMMAEKASDLIKNAKR